MKARGQSMLTQVLLVGLLLAIAGLPVLGYASPPDPAWIPGIYDGADYDDVVVLVTFATGTVSAAPIGDLQPIFQAIGAVLPFPEREISSLSASAVLPRGPPTF